MGVDASVPNLLSKIANAMFVEMCISVSVCKICLLFNPIELFF